MNHGKICEISERMSHENKHIKMNESCENI